MFNRFEDVMPILPEIIAPEETARKYHRCPNPGCIAQFVKKADADNHCKGLPKPDRQDTGVSALKVQHLTKAEKAERQRYWFERFRNIKEQKFQEYKKKQTKADRDHAHYLRKKAEKKRTARDLRAIRRQKFVVGKYWKRISTPKQPITATNGIKSYLSIPNG